MREEYPVFSVGGIKSKAGWIYNTQKHFYFSTKISNYQHLQYYQMFDHKITR